MLILLSAMCTFVGLHDSRTSSDLRKNLYMHWSAENGGEECFVMRKAHKTKILGNLLNLQSS